MPSRTKVVPLETVTGAASAKGATSTTGASSDKWKSDTPSITGSQERSIKLSLLFAEVGTSKQSAKKASNESARFKGHEILRNTTDRESG